jgi:hypothetical protein
MINQFEFKRNVSICKVANSNIDYQNANSPDPTYYRKMPSFTAHFMRQIMENFREHLFPDFENAKSKAFLANPQIDWTAIYQANQINFLIQWNNYGL